MVSVVSFLAVEFATKETRQPQCPPHLRLMTTPQCPSADETFAKQARSTTQRALPPAAHFGLVQQMQSRAEQVWIDLPLLPVSVWIDPPWLAAWLFWIDQS